MKLSKLKLQPGNPRFIRDEKFEKLKKSISEFPQMMALRPVIYDEKFVVLGGNMRLRALRALGYKEVPDEWVKSASDLTEDQKREFTIKDNVGFGEWDWDLLANEWNEDELVEWGMGVPVFNPDLVNNLQPPNAEVVVNNESPPPAETEKVAPTLSMFPLPIVLNRKLKTKWDKLKSHYGIASDQVTFERLLSQVVVD